ncbi:hypothetical protein [Salana multivorans]
MSDAASTVTGTQPGSGWERSRSTTAAPAPGFSGPNELATTALHDEGALIAPR